VSGREMYQQMIAITNFNTVRIQGKCTCPVGYNCKHVGAVCLSYIKNNPVTEEKIKASQVEKWLEDLDKTSYDDRQESSEYFITYRLFGKDMHIKRKKQDESKYLKNN